MEFPAYLGTLKEHQMSSELFCERIPVQDFLWDGSGHLVAVVVALDHLGLEFGVGGLFQLKKRKEDDVSEHARTLEVIRPINWLLLLMITDLIPHSRGQEVNVNVQFGVQHLELGEDASQVSDVVLGVLPVVVQI